MNCPSQDERNAACTRANCRSECGRDTVSALLASDRVLADPETVDALLEFKFLLVERANPRQILRAYFAMRKQIERIEFLLAFRLRKWLEHQFDVTVAVGENFTAHPLSLSFACLRRLEQSFQREIFENNLDVNSLGEIEIDFVRVADTIPLEAVS